MLVLGVLCGCYLLLVLAIGWFSLHPYRIPEWITPGVLGAPHEKVAFLSDQSELRGTWVPAEGSKKVAIFAHGYMMNRSELTPEAFLLWKEGYSALLFDFRAHGKSKGKLSGLGVHEVRDIEAAVAFARSKVPDAKIVVIGSSMGSAAAAMALGMNPVLFDALVLDSCYGRLDSAILGWWRFVGGKLLVSLLAPATPVTWLLSGINPYKVDVSEHLKSVKEAPVLFMHGKSDSLAEPAEAQRNYDALTGPKKIVWFEGLGHSEGRLEEPEKYHDELLRFIRDLNW